MYDRYVEHQVARMIDCQTRRSPRCDREFSEPLIDRDVIPGDKAKGITAAAVAEVVFDLLLEIIF